MISLDTEARRVARTALWTIALGAFVPCALAAQGRGHDHVPGQLPPAGLCRIWFDGLPPGHEPLPTDCATAFRDAPPDARVLVGAGVDASAYGHDHDHGEHRGRVNGHGDKHGDHDDDRYAAPPPPPPPPPRGDCLAYEADGSCAGAHAPVGIHVTLPDMVAAIFVHDGRAWPEAQRWLGTLQVTVRFDLGSNGRPRRVFWTDRHGHVVQEWIDTNGDGRADIVQVYRRGALVRTYHH